MENNGGEKIRWLRRTVNETEQTMFICQRQSEKQSRAESGVEQSIRRLQPFVVFFSLCRRSLRRLHLCLRRSSTSSLFRRRDLNSAVRLGYSLNYAVRHLHLCVDLNSTVSLGDISAINSKLIESEAQTYAQKNSLFFMETSAKTAANVKEIFSEIARRLPRVQPTENPTRMVLPDRAMDRTVSSSCCA
ncbi:uncharacterized protein LOC130494730 [Raphanus sativus]|uniref:Uncharacterized protein LOC130494730 n=1 Tax=Raphanus sativus TaxID=3726 RepID=A0A9W3CXR5_RAPSA|nr:uncharacterized protein LOC130494730 [Raphanus sativus]